ncbi:MAG: putative adhesin, partial [Bacteroidota bacterium]
MITKLPTTASTKTTRNFTLSCTPKFLQTTLLSALFFLLLGVGESRGQTTLISPTGDGGFETGTTFAANGWTAVQGSTTTRVWYCGTGQTGYTGSRSAFIGDNGTTVSTATASRIVHIYRSITIPTGATNITLTFNYKQAIADNTFDYLRVSLLSTTPVNGTLPTADILTTIDPTSAITTYASQSVTIPSSYAGTTRNLVFTFKCDGASPHAYGALDNIGLTYVIPACSAPTALLASSITTTSASLSWTAPASAPSNGYEYAVTSSATPPSSGTANAGTSVSVSSLSANTTYYLHVRSNCGGSGYSSWATSTSFRTPCNATTTPYTQNFESVTAGSIPACTQVVQAGTGNLWSTVSAPGNGFTNMTLKYLYNGTNAANTWYFVNGLNLTAGVTYILSYRYGTVSTATYFENLKVAYGTSATAAAMTTTLATHASVANGTATTNSVTFTPPTSGTYYIGFQCYSTANQNVLYLDDIAVVNQPTIATSGTINAFTSCINTTSTAQNFTVTGADLTANLVITAPTGFQVAT